MGVTVNTESPSRILVVDDEADLEILVQQRMRRSIREGRYEFVFARNGVEALERLRETDVDIVLSDINMPEMDGLTLLQQIPDVDPDVRSVIVTAYGDIDNIRTAMNRGAFDFITKPIDFEDLSGVIERALEHRVLWSQAVQRTNAGQPASAAASAQPGAPAGQGPVLIHVEPEGGDADSRQLADSRIKLTVADSTHDGVMTIAIAGRVEAATMLRFERVLQAVADASERALILDCQHLVHINSAGLRVMLRIAKELRRKDVTVGICSLVEPLHALFKVSGFDQIIPVHDSQADALAACTR